MWDTLKIVLQVALEFLKAWGTPKDRADVQEQERIARARNVRNLIAKAQKERIERAALREAQIALDAEKKKGGF